MPTLEETETGAGVLRFAGDWLAERDLEGRAFLEDEDGSLVIIQSVDPGFGGEGYSFGMVVDEGDVV